MNNASYRGSTQTQIPFQRFREKTQRNCSQLVNEIRIKSRGSWNFGKSPPLTLRALVLPFCAKFPFRRPGREIDAVYEGTSKMQLVRRLSIRTGEGDDLKTRGMQERQRGLTSSATISTTKRRKVYRGGDRINADSETGWLVTFGPSQARACRCYYLRIHCI